MLNLDELLGSNPMLLVQSEMVLTTKSFNIAADGYAVLSGMGGGAGGCKNYAPGNSAPWGVKAIAVRAGDVIAFEIGAGGLAELGATSAAKAGSNTVISINGAAVLTCQGGDAGPATATAVSPLNAKVIGADIWKLGVQPKSRLDGTTPVSGAAVDVGSGTYNKDYKSGDDCVDFEGSSRTGAGVPWGYFFWPFSVQFRGYESGSPGGGGSRARKAGMFGGGGGSVSGQENAHDPGRGGSAGRAAAGDVKNGGAGMGYLRLYQRVNA
ncbi:hypothetical protein [Delftia deserti]|uniref:Uncharacterized protein n=1 Tax=Delftia deserti TaxID=1651218 RepID=A0ABW5EP55_9BURK